MTGLEALEPYNQTLRLLHQRVACGDATEDLTANATAHLDGQANREFRRLISAADRRAMGTFFTGSELRARAVHPHRHLIAGGCLVLDPACGMGDLLLAAADLLPSSWPAQRRAAHAMSHLHGRDLLAPLVELATRRVNLWAQMQLSGLPNGTACSETDQDRANTITTGDAFDGSLDWSAYGLVLLNPPFTQVVLKSGHSWSSGRVTQAAPFTLDVLDEVPPGTQVAAVLPDVLRTGSRYERWRQEVEGRAEIKAVDIYGRFDRWTDVDVFIVHLTRRARKGRQGQATRHMQKSVAPTSCAGEEILESPPTRSLWWQTGNAINGVLQDIAEVSTGDVVPHRHLTDSFSAPPDHPKRNVGYLTIHALQPGGELEAAVDTVNFHGRTHTGPFVVVRRTSAPSRSPGVSRVRPALYVGKSEVAVENHLLVIRPRSGRKLDARALATGLTSQAVTEWFDQRLRLRHITVTALRQMPLELLGGSWEKDG